MPSAFLFGNVLSRYYDDFAMQVFTYYEPLTSLDAGTLVGLWADSWAEQGWLPAVLNEEHARSHPDFERYAANISRLPTMNKAEYERCCYMRWLAMAQIGGGVMTDYDVMNYGFTPERLEREVAPLGNLVVLEPTRVPCCVWGTAEGYEDLCERIGNYQFDAVADVYFMNPTARGHQSLGRPHVSDMTIMRKLDVPTTAHCVEVTCSGRAVANDPGEGWKQAPLVHFSTYSVRRLHRSANKSTIIGKLRPVGAQRRGEVGG